jgi:hypothetical protein
MERAPEAQDHKDSDQSQADLGGDKAKQQHINDKQPSGNSAKHTDAKTNNSGQKLSTAAPV